MSIASKNLKYLRKLRGWTQEEFAAKLKIKRSLLGAYEEERADPRIEVLEIVGNIFKLTLDELLRKDLTETKGAEAILPNGAPSNLLLHPTIFNWCPLRRRRVIWQVMAIPNFWTN
jgi:transcriptional regulator with XRE-family HTH domain